MRTRISAAFNLVPFFLVVTGILIFSQLMTPTVRGDVFVASWFGGSVAEYTNSGQLVNPSLITGLSNPEGIAISGNDIFVANYGSGRVGKYTMSSPGVIGSSTPNLISGLSGVGGITVANGHLFVASQNTNTVGEYTLGGVAENATLLTAANGINYPIGLGVSGSSLYVMNANLNNIGKYTLGVTPGTITGSTPVFISNVMGEGTETYMALVGNGLYTVNRWSNSSIVEWDATTGGLLNPGVVTGLNGGPWAIAANGNELYVRANFSGSQNGFMGKYNTAGQTLNASLITGLTGIPQGIAVTADVPEPASLALLLPAALILLARKR